MADIAKKLFDELKDEEREVPPTKEPLKVFLRIRPLTDTEKKSKEDQGCVVRKGEDVVELQAPPSSFTYKSSNRGFNDTTHQFSFSHIFPECTTQKHFFDQTMLPFVKDILNGVNGLVFTYGVTNSGKTYTFQGTPKDGGILPRALDVIFNSIKSKKYVYPNIKPKFNHEVTYLSKEAESKEEDIRQHLFTYGAKEHEDMTFMKRLNSTTKLEKTVVSRENSMFPDISMIHKVGSESNVDIEEEIRSRITDETNIDMDTPTGVKFGMWVSFMEIYNELIHDLLQITTYGTGKKRPALKLGEDKSGNPYVRGLTEVFVTSSDEAYKVLRVGQKNKHMAATKLNQNSSRSHSIFSIKLMKIVDGAEPRVSRISRLSIVDLAGSERYSKTDAYGILLKEASNINCSIMTLGKCISTLRYNQEHQNHPTIVPFRESKLTRLFQSYFHGKGKASMVVNISPCASVFDETYNVLKFSSVAKEIKMKAERNTEIWQIPPVPKLLATPKAQAQGHPCTPVQKRPPLCIVTPSTHTKKERSLNDPNDFNYNELVCIVKELNEKIKKERKEKAALERTIRGEITKEMESVLKEVDQSHRNELIEQKDSMNQLMENRLDLLTKTVEKQRKRKRLRDENDDDSSEIGTSGTSSVYIEAEKLKVADLEEKLQSYSDHIHAIENENGKLRKLEKDFRDLEETYKMQNKSMKEMQKKLEAKDDQIEKLLEEMEESQRDDQQDVIEENEKRIEALEKELNEKEKEIQIAKANLENRDVHIEQLESKRRYLRTPGTDSDSDEIQKQLDELNQKLKDVEESAALVQFESDEKKFQLEKYEAVLKEQQDTLVDSDNIIVQLNENLFLLKSQLAQQEHLKHSYETQSSLEVGVNTSLQIPERKSNVVETAMNTSAISEKSMSDVGCNTSVLIDVETAKPLSSEIGINTSISTNDQVSLKTDFHSSLKDGYVHVEKVSESMEVQETLEVNEVMIVPSSVTSSGIQVNTDTKISIDNVVLKQTVSSSDACVSTSFVKEESISSAEVGINTTLIYKEVSKSDTGTNTSTLMEEDKSPTGIVTETSVPATEKSPVKSLLDDTEKQFITPPCRKIEVQNDIQSIEGFRLDLKSLSKVKQVQNNDFVMTPERLFSPKNRNTSPSCSPATRGTLQQTIKQFEKLLDDAKKDVDKKSSMLVTKNNRIHQLENQLCALEKKTNLQKVMDDEKTALENGITSLSNKVNSLETLVQEKNDIIDSKSNEINVWMSNTQKVHHDLEKAMIEHSSLENKLKEKEKESQKLLDKTLGDISSWENKLKEKEKESQKLLDKTLGDISSWENKLKVKEKESQELLDSHLSKISLLTNEKVELIKEMEPLKVALGKFEEERKQYKQQSNEQIKQIEDFEFRVGEMQKVINLKTADAEACQKQFAEKEHLLSILQEEKENVLSETTRLNNELKDRRKSRVASQTVMESSLDNYKERIVALQKENEENLEEISSLRMTIVEVQSKCNEMESCFSDASVAKESLAKSETELFARLEDMKLKFSQSEVEVRKLNSVKTKQDMRLRSLEAEIDEVKMTLGDEMDTLKNDLKELSRKHEAMSFELKELNKTEQKLVLENEGKMEIIEKLKENEIESEDFISSLNAELDQLRVDSVQLDNLNKEIEELKEKFEEKESKVSELETEKNNHLESAEVMKETYLKKIEELEFERSDLKTEIERLENEKNTVLTNGETTTKELYEIKKEMDEIKNELFEKQSYIKTLINEKEDFLKKISEMMESMKDEKEKNGKFEKEKKENLALIESLQLNVSEIATSNEEYISIIKAFELSEQHEKSAQKSTRRSKRSTTGTKKNADVSKSRNTSDITEISSILPSINETQSDMVDQVSIACSPLPSVDDATPSFHPPNGLESTRYEPNITQNEEMIARVVTPVPKKKKRLHMLTCTMFETSPDGIDRVTGNEKEIKNATMPMTIKGRRVTRSTRSSVRK